MKTGRLVKGDLVGTPVQDQASMGPSSPRLTTIPQPGYLKTASGPICWLGWFVGRLENIRLAGI